MRGAIKRFPGAERKLQRALCPIHTTQWIKPVEDAHRSLTGFAGSPPPGLFLNNGEPPAAEPYRAPAHSSKARRFVVRPDVFTRILWNRFSVRGLIPAKSGGGLRRKQAMAQQIQQWRSGTGETAWLSALVKTMETLSRPELRAVPCDRTLLAAVTAHLARPAVPYGLYGSNFSLRN
jgi:hypothetical protein